MTVPAEEPGCPKPERNDGNQERFQRVCEEIAFGVKVGVACERHGMPRSTYYFLLKQGQEKKAS